MKFILFFLTPVDEILMVVTVLGILHRADIKLHSGAPRGASRLQSGDGLGAALLCEGIGSGGDLIEFQQECGFVLRWRNILRCEAAHGVKKQRAGNADPEKCRGVQRVNWDGVFRKEEGIAGYAR